MKITAVRLIALAGEMTFPGTFWEENSSAHLTCTRSIEMTRRRGSS